MKKAAIISAMVILGAAIFFTVSCKNKTTDPVKMLTAFYTQYITENSKSQPDEKVISTLYEKFLTAELRKKLEEANLDYDPFLNAQDCDKNWAKALMFLPVEGQENDYTVCYRYTDFRGEQTNCITLFLTKENGNYRINDIENLPPVMFLDDEDNSEDDADFVAVPSRPIENKGSEGIDILLPAMYRGTESADFKHMLSEEWCDFYQDNITKNYYLKKAIIKIGKFYDECLGDSTTDISSQQASIILAKGIKPQNEEIKSIPVKKNHVWVDEKYTFSFNGKEYTFRGEGITTQKGSVNNENGMERWDRVKNYKLYLSGHGKEEQLIVAIPHFNDTFVEILWIGDLDEDGNPDFILDTSTDYEEKAVLLFLSSKAKDGKIVKMVASSSYQYDC